MFGALTMTVASGHRIAKRVLIWAGHAQVLAGLTVGAPVLRATMQPLMTREIDPYG
jgi:hypothetical protein